MSDHLRVLVAVPSMGTWAAGFGTSLISLVAQFNQQKAPGYRSQELRVASIVSSILPRNRMNAVKMAQVAKATFLLFLDSDQTFAPDLLHRLLKHHKLVVAGNYVMKTIPAQPITRKRGKKPEGDPVYTDTASTGLEQVWVAGTGAMLIHMSVFEKIGLGVWDMKYLPEKDAYQGEDWSFCLACEAAGIPIYIDHDVSKSIGHLGQMNYTHDLVGEIVSGVQS